MAKGGFPKGGGYGGGMMRQQAQMQQKILKMQQEMAKAQEAVESTLFTATVGGGTVKATVSGKKELQEIFIDPEALSPEEAETVQDMVVSAVNEALRQAEAAMDKSVEGITSGLNIPGLKF
mgnify:CR=1 FL=1